MKTILLALFLFAFANAESEYFKVVLTQSEIIYHDERQKIAFKLQFCSEAAFQSECIFKYDIHDKEGWLMTFPDGQSYKVLDFWIYK